MGYDLHITRRKHWTAKGHDISSEEWLAVIAGDPELRLQPESGPFFALWSGPSKLTRPWLDWSNGQISSKNPDEALIDKMVDLAHRLGAQVQGDDGEVYKKGRDYPDVERISILQRLVRRLDLLRSRWCSRPKLPPPPFRVDDRVVNAAGERATVKAVNRRAFHGYGEIRVKFDDGRELTFMLIGQDFRLDENSAP